METAARHEPATGRVDGVDHAVDVADVVNMTSRRLFGVQQQLASLLAVSSDPIVRYDTQLRYVYANPAALERLDRSADAVLGRTDRELGFADPLLSRWESGLRQVLASGMDAELAFTTDSDDRRYQSRMIPERESDGVVTGILVISHDLTDRHRAETAERAQAAQAVRDPLTGLPNRLQMTDRIRQALARVPRESAGVAVLFLDLDRFKLVNDTLGPAGGDALLVDIAGRLLRSSRVGDTVARFGGDEFVVLCEDVAGREDGAVIAERIAGLLDEAFTYGGRDVGVTASIGVALAVEPAGAEELIRDAETAMYQAKDRGKGLYQLYDEGVRRRAVDRFTIEGQLRNALDNGELGLAYQPVVSLADRRLMGVEALVRWHHPERGVVPPIEFVPVAEESNLIVPIGRWVLEEACRQLVEWNRHRPVDRLLSMAVNLSARQLLDPRLARDVAAVLRRYRLPPRLLCLEITETAILEDAVRTASVCAGLSALGVQLALDDFGTGYSSLGHLRRFPVNILKIDRMFVSGLDKGTGDDAIVAAVTGMARALGMVTVGEGIETHAQLDELVRLGCDEGQGFLLARPLPPEELERRWLTVE